MERKEPGGRPRPNLRRYQDEARRLTGPDRIDRVDLFDTGRSGETDLGWQADREAAGGIIDLAVSIRADEPPLWLRRELARAITDLLHLPDVSRARATLAARHGRSHDHVLLTPGPAQSYALIAAEFRPRRAVVVHPQADAPEAALRAAGHPVERLVLRAPFELNPAAVPEAADLVLIGNPTNPTSVLHPRATIRQLLRPGRIVVVDEQFAQCVSGDSESLAADTDAGLIVVRALPPAWGLARLRIGYLLACPDVRRRLSQWQSPWPVSPPALAACIVTNGPRAVAEAQTWADDLAGRRTALVEAVTDIEGVDVVPDAAASFVLLRHPGGSGVRMGLRALGFAVRRGDTYPGLGPNWVRVAVPDQPTARAFAAAFASL